MALYFREFETLVDCVREPVKVTCGQEASLLVEYLMRPSIEYSQQCKNDTLYTTTMRVNINSFNSFKDGFHSLNVLGVIDPRKKSTGKVNAKYVKCWGV